jgi:hypothetical protein
LDGGPTGNGNTLYGAAVTDDGTRLWMVGASGAIGEYNVETGILDGHSPPMDVTNNFNDVAVTGERGNANVYVSGDSGEMCFSFENGKEGTEEPSRLGAAQTSTPSTSSAPATAALSTATRSTATRRPSGPTTVRRGGRSASPTQT